MAAPVTRELWVRGESTGPLLGLEGVASIGHWSPDVLSGENLVGFERRFDRVEATYAPPAWGEEWTQVLWAL